MNIDLCITLLTLLVHSDMWKLAGKIFFASAFQTDLVFGLVFLKLLVSCK